MGGKSQHTLLAARHADLPSLVQTGAHEADDREAWKLVCVFLRGWESIGGLQAKWREERGIYRAIHYLVGEKTSHALFPS